jgi:perosamine synthetase
MFLLLDAPNLGGAEKAKLMECVDSTYVSTAGPFVPEFEKLFARYLGTEDCVSVQSGTAALHIALSEAGVGPGDEVIVPALSFAASVNPILYTGAIPVLVDVDPETWTLNPGLTEAAVTPRTRAILPVHLYGTLCGMDKLEGLRKSGDSSSSKTLPRAWEERGKANPPEPWGISAASASTETSSSPPAGEAWSLPGTGRT